LVQWVHFPWVNSFLRCISRVNFLVQLLNFH
jgi:hypothetical protein